MQNAHTYTQNKIIHCLKVSLSLLFFYCSHRITCNKNITTLERRTPVCTAYIFFQISIVGGGIQGPLGTVATNGLLCQPRVIMMIEKLVE
jgi:hypothetical protein